MLMELAVYMRKLRRLMLLDLRSNPVCNVPGYKDVVINTFPSLLNMDARDLDPVEKRTSMMYMSPDVLMFSRRRLLRLLYIQQLTRSKVSPYVPPADTTDVPIIVIVGYEAVGKGSLARRLAVECSSRIDLALQHTTALYHYANHYKVITRRNFDDMLLAGDFLTYSEMDGESYGLSKIKYNINIYNKAAGNKRDDDTNIMER
ncbi:jg13670 [Pararge aegeria aegeria]|uniref:Jg13670 protein n=1 Tax=Pararge aegeria aegeria TaxID=348720 RepID=A0A8S4SE08_9NEOP|nr:jg13670 [Pararge aegeria aegeria]